MDASRPGRPTAGGPADEPPDRPVRSPPTGGQEVPVGRSADVGSGHLRPDRTIEALDRLTDRLRETLVALDRFVVHLRDLERPGEIPVPDSAPDDAGVRRGPPD